MQITAATLALGLTFFSEIVAAGPHGGHLMHPQRRSFLLARAAAGDSCPVNGAIVCTGADSWSMCDHNQLTDMGSVAGGMTCMDNEDGTGSMVKKGDVTKSIVAEAADDAQLLGETLALLMSGQMDWSKHNLLVDGTGLKIEFLPQGMAPEDDGEGLEDFGEEEFEDGAGEFEVPVQAPVDAPVATFIEDTTEPPVEPTFTFTSSQQPSSEPPVVDDAPIPDQTGADPGLIASPAPLPEDVPADTPAPVDTAAPVDPAAPIESPAPVETVPEVDWSSGQWQEDPNLNNGQWNADGQAAPVVRRSTRKVKPGVMVPIAKRSSKGVLQKRKPKLGCLRFYIHSYGPYYSCN